MNRRTITDAELRSFVRRRAPGPDPGLLDGVLAETRAMRQASVNFALLPPTAVLALAATLLVGAILFIGPSIPDVGHAPTSTRHPCADRPPAFEDEVVDPVTVTDATGLVASCRLIGPQQGQAPGAFNPGGDQTRLQVFWVVANCDVGAEVTVRGGTGGYAVLVEHQLDGVCVPGTSLQRIELALRASVPASTVEVTSADSRE